MLKNFQTPTIFLGLFLRKFDVSDFKSFSETLPWRLPELDADAPQFANLPPNAPPDQPRVRFLSKDGRLQLEVAPAKIHFRMMPGEVTQNEQGQASLKALPVPEAFESFIPQAMRVHTTLTEHFGATSSRVGIITDMIAPVPSSANQRIQKYIMGGSNLLGERLADININVLSRVQLPNDGPNVNRRIMVRGIRSGGPQGPGGDLLLNVNVDVNTLAEEPYDITTAELEKFLRGVSKHMDTSVPLLNEPQIFE
ncbi:MAG: hypothetical protein RLY93_10375 [Sumerlaeia bacterium]